MGRIGWIWCIIQLSEGCPLKSRWPSHKATEELRDASFPKWLAIHPIDRIKYDSLHRPGDPFRQSSFIRTIRQTCYSRPNQDGLMKKKERKLPISDGWDYSGDGSSSSYAGPGMIRPDGPFLESLLSFFLFFVLCFKQEKRIVEGKEDFVDRSSTQAGTLYTVLNTLHRLYIHTHTSFIKRAL